MLKIRLQRVGRTHHFSYRIVLTDSRNATQSGRYLEVLGTFDPKADTKVIDAEKVRHWISKGAQVTPTLHNLLITEKIIEGKKINVLPRKSPIKKEGDVKEATPVAASSEPQVKAEEKTEEKVEEVAPVETPAA